MCRKILKDCKANGKIQAGCGGSKLRERRKWKLLPQSYNNCMHMT